ncbi:MAG TPA: DUF4097 family beta strand repeat-containing protein [bacterium]|nr:DUF4097 family beta strand repeat-containing protein [bacterium]
MKRIHCVLSGLLLLVTLPLGAQTIEGSRGHYTSMITREFAMAPGGNLVMEISGGDIRVTSWDKNSVQVLETFTMKVFTREEAEEIVKKLNASYSQNAATLTIRNELDGNRLQEHAFEITLPQKFNLDLKTAGGDLDVSKVEGNVRLGTSGGDLLLSALTGAIEARTSGGDLSLETISGKISAATSGGDIIAKAIFAEGDLSTSGGDVAVEKTTQRLALTTSGGDIVLQDIAGPLTAATSGGDISLTRFSGAQGSLQTSGGDLMVHTSQGQLEMATSGGDVDCEEITKSLRAMTSGGDIDVRDLRAAAEVRSMGGDISVVMTLQDFTVPHALTVETTGGEISITLPARLPATIEAEIRLQRRADPDERNDIYSDFPLTKIAPDETGGRILRSKGEINGGGDLIQLKTTGGDITITKGK